VEGEGGEGGVQVVRHPVALDLVGEVGAPCNPLHSQSPSFSSLREYVRVCLPPPFSLPSLPSFESQGASLMMLWRTPGLGRIRVHLGHSYLHAWLPSLFMPCFTSASHLIALHSTRGDGRGEGGLQHRRKGGERVVESSNSSSSRPLLESPPLPPTPHSFPVLFTQPRALPPLPFLTPPPSGALPKHPHQVVV